MMAAHSSLDDVRNWPIFPRLSPVGLAYGLAKVATNDRISRSTSSCFARADAYQIPPTQFRFNEFRNIDVRRRVPGNDGVDL